MFSKFDILRINKFLAFLVLALCLPTWAEAQPYKVRRGEYLISRDLHASLPLQQESNTNLSFAVRALATTANTVSAITLVKPNVAESVLGPNILSDEVDYDASEHQAFCDQIRRDDASVQNCEPNYIYSIVGSPSDVDYNKLWAMQKISAPSAWEVTTGSANVLVAVVDTGIDYTHPDLAANVWTNPGEIAGNHIDDDHNGYIDDVHGANVLAGTGNPYDDNSHGTHVSGTIGGVGNNSLGVAGVNWSV